MFNNTLISDVKFSMKDSNSDRQQSVVIPAHKYILSISSSVFFAMFYGEMAEPGDTIELPDCDSESFLELLRFVYYDEVKLTGSNVIQILYLAKKYLIPSLSDECTEFLLKLLSADNVFSVLPTADMYEEASLVEKCWEMVDENTEDAMNSEAFLDVSHEMLCSFLERDTLTVREVDIFKAVDRWAEHQCKKQQREVSGEEKRKILGDAVNLIRFPLMKQEEFASLVPKTKVLPKEDALEVLLCFNNAIESPLKFSNIPRRGCNSDIKRVKRFKTVEYKQWFGGAAPQSVAFSVNRNVIIHGVRLFGSEGVTFKVTVGIYSKGAWSYLDKLTEEVGKFKTDKEMTDGFYGFDVLFKEPVPVKKNETYEIRAKIRPEIRAGLMNDRWWYCGIRGQAHVTCDGICFSFSTTVFGGSTNVYRGQFPKLIFSECKVGWRCESRTTPQF